MSAKDGISMGFFKIPMEKNSMGKYSFRMEGK